MRRALLVAATLATLLAPALAAAADGDGPVRLSLPTESDKAVWLRPGFRFGLGLGYSRMQGLHGPPSGNLIGPSIRLGVRLDERWSLLASFQYLFAFGGAGLTGVRYAGTIEPTWHVTPRLSLAVGVGFGGIVEGRTNRPNPDPQPGGLDASYTFPSAESPLPGCSGVGVTGLARGEYLMVIGPRASTGPMAQLDMQWTGCISDTGRQDQDTAQSIVRRQWWPHLSFSLAWMVLWR
jgi:hypothetical protein